MILSQAFNPSQFITQYWQKRPVIIRQLLPQFEDPLDEHELAGLAQEVELEVDSRLVSHNQGHWHVEHGPFENFVDVCTGDWSLLVQGVDRFSEPVHELIRAFGFLPSWRTEDVMVSFSVAGAGVGPHYDQYDVFIIQGKGSRRWQVGEKGNYEQTIPHPKLRQIEPFTPIIDEVLQPGDAIYIPPGFPHNGVALEHCLNYSVGFRAPTGAELLSAFADHVLDKHLFTERYGDPDLAERESTSVILQSEVSRFRDMLQSTLHSEAFEQFLGEFLSTPLCQEDSFPPKLFTPQTTLKAIRSGELFVRALEARQVIFSDSTSLDLAVNGESFSLPAPDLGHATAFVQAESWQAEQDVDYENCLFFVQFVTTLLNSGYWYLEK